MGQEGWSDGLHSWIPSSLSDQAAFHPPELETHLASAPARGSLPTLLGVAFCASLFTRYRRHALWHFGNTLGRHRTSCTGIKPDED